MRVIVDKFKELLDEKQIRKFNLGVVKDYTLPSLNLMPKVHKLTDPASTQNEGQLKGRPIVTGHSWCTLEASRYLQQKFRELLNNFIGYIRQHGYQSTILTGSSDLLSILRKTHLKSGRNYCFATFDFKDLYTNILFEDASKCLHEVALLIGLNQTEIDFYLDLYKFCNEWNYFNVGGELFRQEKGISMGCYFSKEISELVLLYSEYKYQLVSEQRDIEVLARYADDGLMIFSTCNSKYIINEMKTLMLFYPSNLIINVAVNRANCNYLDLKLSFDDVSDKYRKVHFSTYFKKFHTFSYLDPSSNHPQYVLRGLIRTECMRYFRNSFLKKDYMNTIGLFKSRLLKLGYKKGFIDKEILSFEQVKNHSRDKGRDKNFIKDQVLVPIVYDKSNANYKQMRLLFKRAREGLLMAKSILLVNQVLPKMKNLISTRRLLHKKLESLKFGD